MLRDVRLYLDDILQAEGKIQAFISEMDFEQFAEDPRTQDAVIRNFEIIGEAIKHLPENLKNRRRDIPWGKVAGFRDVIAHAYFGVDLNVVWVVATRDLDPVLRATRELLSALGG